MNIGFEGPYSGGKHLFIKKGTLKIHIPYKHKGEISRGLVSEILRQAGINKEEWDKL
ncbi:type II toxin-antitoxin system HicA family toxin [bacterium]|nr:type II toxin-antitoxin system HicA family toxin [bacterium]